MGSTMEHLIEGSREADGVLVNNVFSDTVTQSAFAELRSILGAGAPEAPLDGAFNAITDVLPSSAAGDQNLQLEFPRGDVVERAADGSTSDTVYISDRSIVEGVPSLPRQQTANILVSEGCQGSYSLASHASPSRSGDGRHRPRDPIDATKATTLECINAEYAYNLCRKVDQRTPTELITNSRPYQVRSVAVVPTAFSVVFLPVPKTHASN